MITSGHLGPAGRRIGY